MAGRGSLSLLIPTNSAQSLASDRPTTRARRSGSLFGTTGSVSSDPETAMSFGQGSDLLTIAPSSPFPTRATESTPNTAVTPHSDAETDLGISERSAVTAPRKRARLSQLAHSAKKPARSKTISPSTTADSPAPATPLPVAPDPRKFQPKQIIIGTFYANSESYVTASDEGIVFSLYTEKNGCKSVSLPYPSFVDYMVCDAPQLPVMVLRGDYTFGDKVRKAIPSLKGSDSTIMSCRVFDPRSADRAHWYIILEMESASSLINLMHKVMQSMLALSESPGSHERLNVARTLSLEEAKKRINATKTIILKWKELQLGSWKSKQSKDNTILISGNRIKFKANKDETSSDVTLAINFSEVISLLICIESVCPVLFIRANETFGWTARERLGIPSTFQQGKDYYNSENPETRFKYVTFKLENDNLSDAMWTQLSSLSNDRLSPPQLIDSREAMEMVHNLLYRPIKCHSVRVGANELDELRAVTIYSDSVYICGCMLDSVVTMHLCLGDITEISFCTNDKLPVLFIKTSTTIRDTLKKNMANRSTEVFFDPSSHDVRTQYIVLELDTNTGKDVLDKIAKTLQCILTNFAGRPNASHEGYATKLKSLTKKKSQDLLKEIKEPLKAKDCCCGKKVDLKRKEEVKRYVQSMVNKHGCDAIEKMANRVVDLERKIMCSVCLDKDCQVVFSCGHMICESCDLNLRKCHICRLKILRRVKIFI